MDKLRGGTGMERPAGKSFVLLKAPRPMVVWLGLVGFILGVVLCAFNPFTGERDDVQLEKERKTMTSSIYGAAKTIQVQTAQASIPANMETATFALG